MSTRKSDAPPDVRRIRMGQYVTSAVFAVLCGLSIWRGAGTAAIVVTAGLSGLAVQIPVVSLVRAIRGRDV